VAVHGKDSTREMDGRKRLESLPDRYADDELGPQILSYSQPRDAGIMDHLAFQNALAAMLRNKQGDQEIAVIWIDVVNLRSEFSLRGWAGAESLGRRVADLLRTVADADALLGRVSGGSFLVAMEASRLDKNGRRRIQAVVDALTPLPQRDGTEARPEIAAGVAFYPSDTESAEDLVRFSSLAAARAQYVKTQNVIAFHSRMNSVIIRDHLLEVEMRKGLDQGQFRMVYQPKVDLITGQVAGAEALIRWNHPELGTVAPSEFIPIAERSDLIHRIFELGLRAAMEEARRWRDLGLSLPIIGVNASAANVRGDDFARSVRNILAEIPIAPTQLELEMTESLAFDDEELFATRMRQLKAIGVRIAIDDFGTRYTGFNVLKKSPLDTMKIDQCFIRGIDQSQDMKSLCRTIVSMARHLKLRTVAEGIEEPGELEALRQIGCEAGQGYLFQRPVPAEEFTIFLRKWPERRRDFGFVDTLDLFENAPLYAVG
jgi:EAL domain-containing protein (putative c-di-GMP-specific phosphodiesterase class I)/GGDEF domain-containing protein